MRVVRMRRKERTKETWSDCFISYGMKTSTGRSLLLRGGRSRGRVPVVVSRYYLYIFSMDNNWFRTSTLEVARVRRKKMVMKKKLHDIIYILSTTLIS